MNTKTLSWQCFNLRSSPNVQLHCPEITDNDSPNTTAPQIQKT